LRIEVEKHHIVYRILIVDHSKGTPSNINVIIYTSLKSTFFIRLAVVGSEICKITRNSEKIRTYSSSRSFKVIDLGANQKRVYNFLLVINSNYGQISHYSRDIDA